MVNHLRLAYRRRRLIARARAAFSPPSANSAARSGRQAKIVGSPGGCGCCPSVFADAVHITQNRS
jgi:hypothetical protein